MSVQLVRHADAAPIYPPGHADVQLVQLQGGEKTPTEDVTVVLSQFLPGGRADSAAMPAETVYVIVTGELVITSNGEETTLGAFDSVRLATGTVRVMENRSHLPATMLVIRSTRTSN